MSDASAAERQKRRRALERAGKRIYGLALNAELVDDALVASGLAKADEIASPDRTIELLTTLVAEFLFSVTRDWRRGVGGHIDHQAANSLADSKTTRGLR